MSDQRAAFLQAILAASRDDTPRLVFADWLDEHGDAGDRARAEFVRVQCRLPSAEGNEACNIGDGHDGGYCERCRLRRRERELLTLESGEQWLRGFCGRTRWPMKSGCTFSCHKRPGKVGMDATFSRGFVAHVTLSAADCLRHLDDIRAAQPIERVTLTAVPEWGVQVADNRRCVYWLKGEDAPRLFTESELHAQLKTGEEPPATMAAAALLRLRFRGVAFTPLG